MLRKLTRGAAAAVLLLSLASSGHRQNAHRLDTLRIAPLMSFRQLGVPLVEYEISGSSSPRKNALVLQMSEFSDYSQRSYPIHRDAWGGYAAIDATVREPDDYTRAKFNVLLNPGVCGIDNTYCVAPGTKRSGSHKNDFDISHDRLNYARFSNPAQLFEYATRWKGKRVQRLQLHGHGNVSMFGHNTPNSYVDIDYLLKKYTPSDFAGVVEPGRPILLQACSVNANHQGQLTIGEVISYLFDAPVVGPTQDAISFHIGMSGPAKIRTDYATKTITPHWYDQGKPEVFINNLVSYSYYTVTPDAAAREVEQYLSRIR